MNSSIDATQSSDGKITSRQEKVFSRVRSSRTTVIHRFTAPNAAKQEFLCRISTSLKPTVRNKSN